MSDLDSRLERVEERLETLSDIVIEYDSDLDTLADDVRAVREELDHELALIRTRLSELEDRTELLQTPADGPKSKHHRAALALDTLYNRAKAASSGRAALDAEGVATANNGEIKRAYATEVMRAVPEIVDDNAVCWIIDEDRHADQNTRVALDLTDYPDAVPASAAGVRIHDGGKSA